MRLVAVALLLALAACGSDTTTSSEPTAAELQLKACEGVRAGIAAFNEQDYAGTVEEFADAEEPAKAFAAKTDSNNAEDLLEAVTYYAELAPDDYAEAARSSKDFAKYKAITLGQCTDGKPLDQPTDEPTLT